MPRKSSSPLPEALRYLQPFARSLAKLTLSELNEDIDPARLETALRKRILGLDADAAEAELAKDRALLESWLKEASSEHAAYYWILGFLMSPDLAAELVQPPVPAPRGPELSFATPVGWKAKNVYGRIDLRKGKTIASIMVIDHLSFDMMQCQQESYATAANPRLSHEMLDVDFGGITGKKYVCRQLTLGPWKRIDYVLRMPAGFAVVILNSPDIDFDESPFESKLHTLRISE
jgi:hypothetical protein